MATIDKGSITATATNDPKVFVIGFDFTDDTVTDANTGWLYTWKHAVFRYNSNMTGAQFNAAANAGMSGSR